MKINGIEYDNAKDTGKYYLHEVLLSDAENGAVSFKTGTLAGYPSDIAPLSPDGKAEANPSDASIIHPDVENVKTDGNMQAFGQEVRATEPETTEPTETSKTQVPHMEMTFGGKTTRRRSRTCQTRPKAVQ